MLRFLPAAVAGAAALAADRAMAQATGVATAAPDKGDTAWMLVSTILVVMMTVPGLALFYGGLVRARNVLSVLMQVVAGFSMVAILWMIYGYSVAFSGWETVDASPIAPFFGGLSKAFLAGIGPESLAATFTAGVYIPESSFVAFQLAFAAITPALIVGATAERMKFPAVLAFLALWFTFSYLPMAHMVWWPGGFLFGLGALDFAGGTVVHINAGVAGLVAALTVGRRVGFGRESMAPHNLPLTLLGAGLLWVGWFGFNAGSALEANGQAAVALLNTILAGAAAALTWSGIEAARRGHASLLGAASGAVAGLVAITPAAGFAGYVGGMLLGAAAVGASYWAVVVLKPMLKYDDSLDVFGIHGVSGIVGAIGTGIVGAPSLGGFAAFDSIPAQMATQVEAVVLCIAWSAAVAFLSLLAVRATIGLRVAGSDEREGLDLTSHGETAYGSAFTGRIVPLAGAPTAEFRPEPEPRRSEA